MAVTQTYPKLHRLEVGRAVLAKDAKTFIKMKWAAYKIARRKNKKFTTNSKQRKITRIK